MTTARTHVVLRHIRGLAAGASDRHLLERFTTARDEAAFAELVRRHGAMVLGVSRRVLRDPNDADDAFQATFLVLARKAASIGKAESVGGWLYRVAYHTALKARARAATRQRREALAASRPPTDPLAELSARDLLAVLDEELSALSERLRGPLVLCYLEGKTRDEAARQLGWTLATLKRRLEEGRERLRARLARRDVALPGAILAAGVIGSAVPAALAERVQSTREAAPHVTALAGETLRVGTFRNAVAAVLLLGSVAVGVGLLALRSPAPADEPKPPAPEARPKAPLTGEKKETTVTGRVLDAAGEPVREAQVGLVAGPYVHGGGVAQLGNPQLLGQTTSDKEGRFRLTAPATSSGRHYLVKVFAAAPGHGLGQTWLDPNAPEQEEVVRLSAEQFIRGQLIDLQGVPVAGCEVRVHKVWGQGKPHVVGWFSEPIAGLKAWPATVKTDAAGRFEVRGLAPGLVVTLRANDDRFAVQDRDVDTRSDGRPAVITWSLAPIHALVGKVLAADTGEPISHARVEVASLAPDGEGPDAGLRLRGTVAGRCDAEGRFRINPLAGTEYRVQVTAPPDRPYLAVAAEVRPARGTTRKELTLRLPTGVIVRGKIRDAASGEPVAGAAVQFEPRSEVSGRVLREWNDDVRSGPDGRFALAVPPQAGLLLVKAPTADYVHAEMTDGHFLTEARSGGSRYYPDAVAEINPKPGVKSHEVELTLRRGVTVQGRLVDPDGKPVRRAGMICPAYVPVGYRYLGQSIAIHDGRFEVPGIDPDRKVRVMFYDAEHELGATVELSGKAAGEPIEVKLKPCGAATVRFVDTQGRALDRPLPAHLELVVTPGGPPPMGWGREDLKEPAADTANLGWLMRSAEDGDGRVRLHRLIPGATYRLTPPLGGAAAGQRGIEFVAESGKTVRLPDVKVPVPGK